MNDKIHKTENDDPDQVNHELARRRLGRVFVTNCAAASEMLPHVSEVRLSQISDSLGRRDGGGAQKIEGQAEKKRYCRFGGSEFVLW